MGELILKAQTRQELGRDVKKLRAQGMIPAVLYGLGKENKNLVVAENDFAKAYAAAGDSTLIDLEIADGDKVRVLVQDVQYELLKHTVIHVDFYQVDMAKKTTANVPLVFTGESPAVKEQGAVLITNIDNVEVKCLPGDLIKEIVIDLSLLKVFGDKITVADILDVSDKIEILTPLDMTIATVAEPRKQEDFSQAPAAATPGDSGEVKPEPSVAASDNEKNK